MKPFREAIGYAEDLQAAYDYYRRYGTEAAARFLVAYQKAEGLLREHPHVARVRGHGWRQLLITGYPRFSIFYKELPDFWLAGAILSTLQDPDWIQARLVIREASEAEE